MVRRMAERPLRPEQRDMYAKPGSLLRQALDAGVLPWPTLEEIQREDALADLISDGRTTLADGTAVTLG